MQNNIIIPSFAENYFKEDESIKGQTKISKTYDLLKTIIYSQEYSITYHAVKIQSLRSEKIRGYPH